MKKYVWLGIFTVAALATMFIYSTATAASIPAVNVVTVKNEKIETFVTCSGKIEETQKRDIILDSPVVIDNVNVGIGDKVKSGDSLFSIDKDATKSLTSQSISDLTNSIGGYDTSMLDSYNIPQEVLSQIQGIRVNGTDQDEEDSTEKEIPDEITAPITGVVTAINVSSGGLTGKAGTVATISDLTKLQVKVSINENQIDSVKAGQKVTITGNGFKDRTYTGTISKIFPAARQQLSGTNYETVVDALVVIDQPDEYLKPNYTAKVKILTSDSMESIIVPYEAVEQDEKGQEYVYVYSMSSARKRNIVTGRELESGIEVVTGLKVGDRVVTTLDQITSNAMRVTLMTGGESGA